MSTITTTEKYIGYGALVSYLTETSNYSYRGFLYLNRDIIISSLNSLLTSSSSLTLSKWQSFDIAWYNRFLDEAKGLLESSTFFALKKKINTEHLRYAKKLQEFWEGIIKECEKENLISAATAEDLSKTSQSDFPETLQPIIFETSQSDLPKTLQSDLPKISQLELSKKNIKDICCDILYELESTSYAYLFFDIINNKRVKHPMDLFTINSKLEDNEYISLEEFEEDIRLIFCNCYTYNDVESKIYYSGKALESIFNKKWNEKLILQGRQTRELKRVRENDNDTDTNNTSFKKQIQQILEQNEDKLVYKQVINDGFLIASAYENLITGNIMPFIEILKTFLLSRSMMSLFSADEAVLQAIVESLLPLKYRIPELSLIMDGKKQKGSGRFGYSDIFVLKEISNDNISLELKYISLVGLMKNQKNKFGANDLENLDKVLEKEDEKFLLERLYTYWSKEHEETKQTTINEVLNNGINQLKSYMNIISKGKPVDYFSSGVFDKRIKITKSNPNKLKGFVILVVGFRRILWRSVGEVISNYKYDKI
ncbi:hypothetical protein RclHR1_15990001 [Rhizophagus clarus]|uniref:Bromo domain-containing protein n=2 Tax=Rhizophagus clarus TaxID=94130 RepID=A0A2Z6QX33_9GLOM|nr:hypothetical protein RclHR1_15990001 [Rhizophagus clarus]GES81631.1 hypothetical protein GLOIN_2v1781474 [Rhizophagus clarus]